LTGYIRGKPLDVNGLVHIPGWGDFQLAQLDAPEDPHPLVSSSSRREGVEVEMEASSDRLLESADPKKQESLISENVPDPMDAEQTWPTAEEMEDAEDRMSKKKIVKKVPKGTSEYQAAWIPDSDGGNNIKWLCYFYLFVLQKAVMKRKKVRMKTICAKNQCLRRIPSVGILRLMIWSR